MTYITTFNTTFFALWIYYAVALAAAAGIWRVWGKEFIKPGNTSLRYFRWTSNGLWLVALGAGLYFSIEGTTTFLACCVLLGCVGASVERYMAHRRLQRELSSIGEHMVDTLPKPLVH